MIYAVYDTNVIVSAFITHNSSSPTRIVIEKMIDGEVTPVYSDEIIEEYREVLSRPKFALPMVFVDNFLEMIKKLGVLSDRRLFEEDMPDEDDRVFYEVCLSVDDSFLVTGNLKHFPQNAKVVTASQFLSIINGSNR